MKYIREPYSFLCVCVCVCVYVCVCVCVYGCVYVCIVHITYVYCAYYAYVFCVDASDWHVYLSTCLSALVAFFLIPVTCYLYPDIESLSHGLIVFFPGGPILLPVGFVNLSPSASASGW